MAADKEIMRALDTLRLDRPGRVRHAPATGDDIGQYLIDALRELAATYREEAGLWARSGAKGWKSAEAEAYVIAQRIDEVAAQLDNAGGGAALSVSEPFVQTDAATTHERLDDFVSSAVAAGKGTLRPPSMSAVQFSEPLDLGGTAVALAERPVSDGVEAYLKGEVDTLPGLAEALVPNSITDYCSDCDHATHRCGGCGDSVDHGESTCAACRILHAPEVERIDRPALAPEPILVSAGATELMNETLAITMPKTWESDTLTADGHRPPGLPQAPTLGQPGDMGTGYSHSYIPAGGRRVAYADLLTPVPAASLPPHLSHSQTRDVGDCATKYRLQRVEQLPQIPQWANIGGTAFHAAVEAFELTLTKMPHAPVSQMTFKDYDVETTWKHHFEGQITAVAMTTPVPQSVWRAARKGAEGEQWWRVNGPLMLRRYLDARPDEVTMDIPVIGIGGVESLCGIETDLTVDVPTPYGPLPFNAKIDRVTVGHLPGRPEVGAIIIRDYKTSYERPTDTTQLGDYANVLRLAFAHQGPIADVPIYGTYFDARRGTWTEPVDLLDAHPFEAFQYRVTAAHAQKSALTTGPTPARKSDFCGGCAVRYACPIMATKT
jgi:hypothetical protein